MAGTDDTAFDEARRRVRNEIFVEQRRMVDRADAIGIIGISIGVPFALWDHVDHGRLVVWGVLLLVATFAWSGTTIEPNVTNPVLRVFRSVWIWGSSILWAALPWLEPAAVETDVVAWILVFVVTYGIASDAVFIPQTGETSLGLLLSGYTSSYLIALAIAGQWMPTVATVMFLTLLVFGGNGWKQITDSLIDRRVEGEIRSLVDDLTGIGTRVAATLAVGEMLRAGADEVHCVFLDIDDFKQLNDTYGYAVGDEALRVVAARLTGALPEGWTAVRFGGDEFVAVGPCSADFTGLTDVRFELPAHAPGSELDLTLSIGVTVLPATEATPTVLFREAGAALRAAKAGGKNQIVTMTSRLRAREADRVALGGEVASALEQGNIVAYGQAISDLRTGRPVGVELLARWLRPDGSIVMPDEFVPVIEEQGRGPQLGDVMMSHAVEFLARLRAEGVTDVYATVNISARHLFHRSLARRVAATLEGHGIPPHRLILEVTESQHLPQSSIWHTTAEQLRAVGVGLAIDDFGTGYSSMEQLLSMPFSHLKVDRIITRALDRPGAVDLAAAIAKMADGGDMTAIVEGIETEAERRTVLDAGYLYGQGFLFARPVPLEEMIAVLTATPDRAR